MMMMMSMASCIVIDICIPAERVVADVAVNDLDVVGGARVVSLESERVERECYDEAGRCSYEPRAVDAVRVDARMLR